MQTKANSPLEMFEQFEQSDDLRLWTKGGLAGPGWDKQNVVDKHRASGKTLGLGIYGRRQKLGYSLLRQNRKRKMGFAKGMLMRSWRVYITGKQGGKSLSAQGEKFWRRQKGDDSRTHPPHQGDFSFVLA